MKIRKQTKKARRPGASSRSVQFGEKRSPLKKTKGRRRTCVTDSGPEIEDKKCHGTTKDQKQDGTRVTRVFSTFRIKILRGILWCSVRSRKIVSETVKCKARR